MPHAQPSPIDVPVVAEHPGERARAEALAERFGLSREGSSPLVLVLTPERLELRSLEPNAPGAVFVDFIGGAVGHRHRFGGGRGQPLARAAGLRSGISPELLDATAGLGRDAFVLASLGCRVRMVERSPVLAALLDDGLARAAADPDAGPVVARMTLVHANAVDYLTGLTAERRPQVVYLDPMFPARGKSAAVKKEMQLLQRLEGPPDPGEEAELLAAAWDAATARVVVKRPASAPPLPGRSPSAAVQGPKHRFDLYVRAALRADPEGER